MLPGWFDYFPERLPDKLMFIQIFLGEFFCVLFFTGFHLKTFYL